MSLNIAGGDIVGAGVRAIIVICVCVFVVSVVVDLHFLALSSFIASFVVLFVQRLALALVIVGAMDILFVMVWLLL